MAHKQIRIIPHSKPFISFLEKKNLSTVLKSGQIATGPMVKKFEKALSKKIGMKYATAVNSGSSALHLALLTLGIKKGDSVIIPDFVCTALLNCVKHVGATPILADINRDSPNISFLSVKEKINKSVKAIIIPHMFGVGQDITPFKKFNVPIIEDCAQTFGFKVNSKNIGSMGDISIFSFYATKLICAGEGGMVLTNSKVISEKIEDLREYDEKNSAELRYNYKMSDIHASLGLAQLQQLSKFIKMRKENAVFFNNTIKNELFLPVADKKDNIYFRYIVKCSRPAKEIVLLLNKRGISARLPVYKCLSSYLGIKACRNSKHLFDHAVSIPVFPGLKLAEKKKIVSTINKLLK